MFKAVSTPLPNLKDWRFSVDQWGIGWAEFDREGESQNSFGRRPFEELAQIVAKVEEGARSREIRGLVIASGKERGFIVGADIREFADLSTEMDVIDRARPAFRAGLKGDQDAAFGLVVISRTAGSAPVRITGLKLKSGGITPMTVRGRPSTVMVCPTIVGSALNDVRHSRSLMIAL